MARAHTLSGAIAGVGLIALVPAAPWPVKLLAVAVTGGAALLPDLDHPPSTAARSLGFVTRWIARGLAWLSLVVYEATRGEGDPAGRRSGHRLATHTIPGCLLAGLLAWVAAVASPVSCAVVCGLLCGLLGLGLRAAGGLLAVVSAGVSWWCATYETGWLWLVGAGVVAGCLAHLAGDWVTTQGIPVAWPVLLGDQRWRFLSSPATFPAGGPEETLIVTPALAVGLVAAGGWATGLLPMVVSAVATAVAQ